MEGFAQEMFPLERPICCVRYRSGIGARSTAITVCGTLSALGMSWPVGSVPEVQCDINVFVDGNAEPIARLTAAQIIYVINLFLRACAFMHRYEYEHATRLPDPCPADQGSSESLLLSNSPGIRYVY